MVTEIERFQARHEDGVEYTVVVLRETIAKVVHGSTCIRSRTYARTADGEIPMPEVGQLAAESHFGFTS